MAQQKTKTKTLPVRMDPVTYQRIQAEAEREGMGASTWIRHQAIRALRRAERAQS